MGFGLDSIIELVAAAVLLWRVRVEAVVVAGGVGDEDEDDEESPVRRIDAAERRVRHVVAVTFFLLAMYVSVQSIWVLVTQFLPEESLVGIVLAAASLGIMPLVAWGKFRAATALGSLALKAEAKETLACSYLSFCLFLGLGLNAAWGLWRADPIAALFMVPWLVKEGMEGFEEEEEQREEEGADRDEQS